MKKLAKILIPIFVVALVMGCFFIFASAAEETTVYKADGTEVFTGTLSNAVAYVNDSATNGSGLTIKLNRDVTVGAMLTITAPDFTLDLNGRTLTYLTTNDTSILFKVEIPTGVDVSSPLITGNGNIQLRCAALFDVSTAADTENPGFAQLCLGAREQLSDKFEQLPVVDIDTMINVNVQGGSRIVRFKNDGDAFYAQNVNFYCSGNAGGDKVNGKDAKFALNTVGSYVRLVNSSWQGTQYDLNIPLATVCADGAYVQLDNCVARTSQSLLFFPTAINADENLGPNFEVVRINNSVLDLGVRAGLDTTTGNLISMNGANEGTGCYGTIAIKGSEVTSYRFIEHGNFKNDLQFNLQDSTFKTRDHGSSSLFLRASTDVYAENCKFEVNKDLIFFGGDDTPTLTFINCRFDMKPDDAPLLKAADGTSTVSYDLSDTQYPIVLNSTGADTGITYFTAYVYDNEDIGTYGTGTHFTEKDGKFTLVPFGSTPGLLVEAQTKIGQVDVVRSVSHNRYFLYTLTDPYAGTSKASTDGKIIMNTTVDNNMISSDSNLYNDPYFTLGFGYTDGATKSLVSADGSAWNTEFGAMVLSLDLTGGENGLIDLDFQYFGRGNFSSTVGITVRNNVISGNKASKSIDPEGWTHLTVVYTVEGGDTDATKTIVARAYVEGVLFDERTVIAAGKVTGKTWIEGIRLQPVSSTSQFIGSGFGLDNLYTATYSDASKLPASFAPTHKMVNKYEAEVGGVYYETVGEAIDAVTNPAFQYVDIVEEVTSEISKAQFGKGVRLINHKDKFLPFNPTISPLEYPPIIGEDGKAYVATVTTTVTEGSPVLKFLDFSYSGIYGGGGNSADRYIGYDMENPVTNIAYSIIDESGAVEKVATNVFSIWYDLANLKDGYTFKLYTDIAGPGSVITIPQTGTVNIDLNGYRIVQNARTESFSFTGNGATVNVYSSRPGAAILSVMDDSYADKAGYYNYNLNNGLSFFNVNNSNITFNLNGENLTWAGTTLVTADSSRSKAYTGITINVNGGTYVQCGYDGGGIFHSNNDERVTFNISNANFYLEGINESYLFTDASTTYTVTIDGCVIVDNNNNAKCAIVSSISNFRGTSSIIIRNTHVGLRTAGETVNYTTNDATYGKYFTIGANVTSAIPFPADATFEDGCSNNTLETPTAHGLVGNVSSITVPVARGLAKDGTPTTGLTKFLRYKVVNTKKNNRTTIALVIRDGGVNAEGNINPDYVIYNPYGLTKLNSNALDTKVVAGTITVGTDSFELKYENYCWGCYGIDKFDVDYSATMSNNVKTAMTCNYASTVQTLNYTAGGSVIKSVAIPGGMSDDEIKALTVPSVSGTGVEGLYELSGWQVGTITRDGNTVTAPITATSVTNKLAISSTLVLQDNFTYRILVKKSLVSNITAFEIDGATVSLENCPVAEFGGVEYYSIAKTIKPSEVGNAITVKATYAVEGAAVDSKTVGWKLSVANYANAVLALTTEQNVTVNDAAKQLMAEVLNYIKVLDTFYGRTVNADIESAIAAYAAKGFTAKDIAIDDTATQAPIDNVATVGLAITEEGFKLRLTFTEGATGNVGIVVDDRIYNADASAGTYELAINAYDLARLITINGVEFKIEAYYAYALNHAAGENEEILIKAIKAYGIAADAYMDYMESISAE